MTWACCSTPTVLCWKKTFVSTKPRFHFIADKQNDIRRLWWNWITR
ncbi:hypothetical protein ACVXHA_02900 [Escherichia coli]